MKVLTILYDAQCGLCQQSRDWLARQPVLMPLEFLPLQSPTVDTRFPGIRNFDPERQLLAVADSGEVYAGHKAWLICLWATREWRELACELANPLWMPFARLACELISTNRFKLSEFIEMIAVSKRNQMPS